ncbi:response regulator [Azospirillum sp. A26]|uniref:response regulator n=1 Tax=Azospirillum sp. A26 TaxID=3160607 RepID=UPI00366D7F06
MNRKPILLVEGDARDRDLFLEACREAGLGQAPVVVRDGEEALRLLSPPLASAAPLHPAVVVFALPALGGMEGLRRFKAAAPDSRPIPMVVFSAARNREDVGLCYAAGANAYVVKPEAFSELVQTVRTIDRFWCGLNRLPSRQKLASIPMRRSDAGGVGNRPAAAMNGP